MFELLNLLKWMQALYRRDRIAVERGVGLAAAAKSLSSKGLFKNAFDTLMDVEPLIFEATALLNAAIVNRSEGETQRSD